MFQKLIETVAMHRIFVSIRHVPEKICMNILKDIYSTIVFQY